MNDTIPLRTRPMTANEVLESLRDLVADSVSGDNLDEVTFETRLVDYYPLFDDTTPGFLDPRGRERAGALGKCFNGFFRIEVVDWRPVLLPLHERTLRDVCQFVANQNAEIVEFEPIAVLGRPCVSARTFLALKSMLADSRVNVDRIAPSTILESEAAPSRGDILRAVARAAPGLVCRLRMPIPGLVWLWMALMIVVCFTGGLVWPWVGKWLVCRFVQLWQNDPRTMTHPDLGPLVTFRDLTRAVLYHRSVTLSPTGTAP
jgi:hypothetical protein